MSVLFPILLLIAYLSICYQDFKAREVYLLTYAVLYGVFLISILSNRFALNIDFVIINTCILVAVICLLLVYYILRYQDTTVIRLKASVGWGDVLMLPAFIVCFSPGNLIVVFIFSLVLSLAFYVVSNSRSSRVKTIPLAGIQALVLSVLLSADFLGFLKMQVDYFPIF
jgi:hypothetical protein